MRGCRAAEWWAGKGASGSREDRMGDRLCGQGARWRRAERESACLFVPVGPASGSRLSNHLQMRGKQMRNETEAAG